MKRSETAAPRRILRFFGRTLLLFFTVVLVLCATLLASLRLICSNVSPAAKRVFVTTMLETGQLKFLASLLVSQDEIRALVASNALAEFNDSVDSSLITVGVSSDDPVQGEQPPQPDIAVEKISGRTFLGTMILLKDPSRLSVASIYPWREKGVTIRYAGQGQRCCRRHQCRHLQFHQQYRRQALRHCGVRRRNTVQSAGAVSGACDDRADGG